MNYDYTNKTYNLRVNNGRATLDGVEALGFLSVYTCRVYTQYASGIGYGYETRRQVLSCVGDYESLGNALARHEHYKKQALYTSGRWRADLCATFDIVEDGVAQLVAASMYAECMSRDTFQDVESALWDIRGVFIRVGWERFPSLERRARLLPASCTSVSFA